MQIFFLLSSRFFFIFRCLIFKLKLTKKYLQFICPCFANAKPTLTVKKIKLVFKHRRHLIFVLLSLLFFPPYLFQIKRHSTTNNWSSFCVWRDFDLLKIVFFFKFLSVNSKILSLFKHLAYLPTRFLQNPFYIFLNVVRKFLLLFSYL